MTHYFPVTHSTLSAEALAREVLPHYGLPPIASIRFLSFGLNDTYTITSGNGDRYVLRIYRAGWRTLSDICYEIDVLNYLSSQGVPVSIPLRREDGTYIQTLPAPEGARHAVLFTYGAGKEPSYEEKAESEAFTYGKVAGMIHRVTQGFTSQHARFGLDLNHLLDAPLKSIAPLLMHRQEDWAYLQELADRIRTRFAEIPGDRLEQGFCHGDFHGGNAHFTDEGAMTLFDFDNCGWGWRAYDVAVFRWGAKLTEQKKDLWEPFLRGYREEKAISEPDWQAVPLFFGIRHFWLLGLHTGNGPVWGFGWMNDKYFDRQIKFLRDWDDEYFERTQKRSSIT